MNAASSSGEPTAATLAVRPKGIWVITIWLGLFAGLLPIGLVLFFYFAPPEDQRILSGFDLAISLSLGFAILVAALAAWFGFGWARYALMVLAIVHYGLIAYNNYTIAVGDIVPEGKLPKVWAQFVKSLITMIIMVLYLLLSRRARDFFTHYRRRTSLVQSEGRVSS